MNGFAGREMGKLTVVILAVAALFCFLSISFLLSRFHISFPNLIYLHTVVRHFSQVSTT